MFLGIDLGTSEAKVLLLDGQHRIVATASEPLAISRPRPGWSEQDPADWWSATDRAVRKLAATQPLGAVQAIGLAGQMHGAVLLDAADAVLRRAILWNDGRSQAECAEMEAALPRLRAIAGNMAMPGFTAPKLWWLRRNEPAVFDRVATVLLPKDWLRLRLTGERISDLSDASGTLWLDVGARRWSTELLAASGLGLQHMPALVEGSARAGTLRAEVAQAWGLRAGIPVAGGGGDNAASAVGVGAVRAGQGFLSLGTSGVIFLAQERYEPRPDSAVHTYCHALPGLWHQMGVMLSAGSALRWACRLLGSTEAELLERVAALDEAALASAPLFLPYLDGERTPHNDADARGVLFGLTGSHDAASVTYAVIEGVAFGLRDGWQAMGAPGVEALSLVGGGARSALWARLLASALDVKLQTCEGAEAGGALGAARLAWLAAGGDAGEVCRPSAVRGRFEPDPAVQARLGPRHARFRTLYPALKDAFRPPAIH
ncbi:xylulokinase [Ramlibacter sp. G-1-2-2]|uniref:Xylulose kinase n=1 Tax=Ramlibacter agri TaxID=2728837 RepID=A0A848GZN6_9BURK|nr:xylulokinase [Ramlibacter agri]NML42851.1 xylulokinase [Ramlibacter agri]